MGREERAGGPGDRGEDQGRDARPDRASRRPRSPGRRGRRRRACPVAIPTTATAGSRSPKKIRPRTATQTGIIAIRTPAIPDGTVCSPHADEAHAAAHQQGADDEAVAPLAAGRHCDARRGGGSRPRRASRGRRCANRAAAMTNGGIVSTATRIPRYVEPQTTYRMRIAVQTSTGAAERAPLEACGSGRRWHSRLVQSTGSVRHRVAARARRPAIGRCSGAALRPPPAGSACTAGSRPSPRPAPTGSGPGADR